MSANSEYAGFPTSPFFISYNLNNYTLDPRDPLNTQYNYVDPTTNKIIFPNAQYLNLTSNTTVATACPGSNGNCAATIGTNFGGDAQNSCGCFYEDLDDALAACLAITSNEGYYDPNGPLTCLGVLSQNIPPNMDTYYQPFSMNPVYTNTTNSTGVMYQINPGFINSKTSGTYPTSAQVASAQMAIANYNYYHSYQNNKNLSIPPTQSSYANLPVSNPQYSECSSPPCNTSMTNYITQYGSTTNADNMYLAPLTYCPPGLTPFGMGDLNNPIPTITDITPSWTSQNGENWEISNSDYSFPSTTGLTGYWSLPQEAFGCACPPPYNWSQTLGCVTPNGSATSNLGNYYSTGEYSFAYSGCNSGDWNTFDPSQSLCCTATGPNGQNGTLNYSLNTNYSQPGGIWTCGCGSSGQSWCTNSATGTRQCGCDPTITPGCNPTTFTCAGNMFTDPYTCGCTCPPGQQLGNNWECIDIPCPAGYSYSNGGCIANIPTVNTTTGIVYI